MATRHPERNFIGAERLLGRVRKTARKAHRAELHEQDNLRVTRLDSAYLAGWLLPDDSIDRFHLLCPDPWPKKKHHKNRFVRNLDFHRGLGRKLRQGGLLLFKTDHEEYYEEGLEELDRLPFLARCDWPEEEFYAETDFERQWVGEGKTVRKACWMRIPAEI